MFWDICQLQPVFLAHALSSLYTGQDLQSRSDSAYPTSHLHYSIFVLLHFFGGVNIWIAYIYFLNFLLSSCLKSNTTCPWKHMVSTWDQKEQLTMNLPSLCPWGDWCRSLLPRDYSFSMPWGWLWINGEDLVFRLEIGAASETARDTLRRPLTTVLRSSFLLHTIALSLSVWGRIDFISAIFTDIEAEVPYIKLWESCRARRLQTCDPMTAKSCLMILRVSLSAAVLFPVHLSLRSTTQWIHKHLINTPLCVPHCSEFCSNLCSAPRRTVKPLVVTCDRWRSWYAEKQTACPSQLAVTELGSNLPSLYSWPLLATPITN